MTASTFVKQGDPRWSTTKLGIGDRTHGQWGCAVAAITEAAFQLGTIAHKDPRMTNDAAVEAGAFAPGKSAAVLDTVARAVGLKMGPRVVSAKSSETAPAKIPHDVFARIVASYLASRRLALLHVDHGGDDKGDHWLLAMRTTSMGVHCADPATGELVVLGASDLSGVSGWKDKRVFEAVAFRTLTL